MSALAQTVEELNAAGRVAQAHWREFDFYLGQADFADAVLAMHDAWRSEDEAALVVRPHVRAAFSGTNGRP